ncbi:TIGR01777 family protein [Arthrobacter livingstonensis]|uniref:TIGR01777 family protein n=1 Tax=Arthrobacter livingstonensis TaxID=670078 RepID=A0A2V5L2I7_9MICC|nr:TIGR01777 family oxidoreductase [Arthrobacter livingstonensis]PYI64354.1 TIGR01777 family protein [Arthrobacter livingstonensis]
MHTFRHTTALPFPRAEVFTWFTRPGALVRLTPSFLGSVLAEPGDGINPGSTATLGVGAPGGLGLWLGAASGTVQGLLPAGLRSLNAVRPQLRWEALHTELVPGESFTDVMTSGPLTSWTHRHNFTEGPVPESTVMTDTVNYELPSVAAGARAVRRFEAELERMFAFRARQLSDELAFHRHHAGSPLTLAVTGASGLIGSQLCALLSGGGHTVVKLVRRTPRGAGEIFWDPSTGTLDAQQLAGCDAVVHLAGHTIGGRFTAKTKDAIYRSRIQGTTLLSEKLALLASDGVARTLVCGSAIGYYGASPHDPARHHGQASSRAMVESDPAGTDFLAQVCADWEAACRPAADAGVRVVNVRTGLVQSAAGGVLQRLLPLYLAGVGGPLGKDQWQSWIGIDDIAGIFAHAVLSGSMEGPVNAVAPHPVTAEQYAHILGGVLHRPAVVKVPSVGPRLLLGREGATELALADQRASSAKVVADGYQFRHESLDAALRHILGA